MFMIDASLKCVRHGWCLITSIIKKLCFLIQNILILDINSAIMGLEQRLFEINFMNIFLLIVASFVNTRSIPFYP